MSEQKRKFYATATGMLGYKNEDGEIFIFSLVPVSHDRATLIPMPITVMALAEGGLKDIPKEMFEITLSEENAAVLVELSGAIAAGKLPKVKLVTQPPQIVAPVGGNPMMAKEQSKIIKLK